MTKGNTDLAASIVHSTVLLIASCLLALLVWNTQRHQRTDHGFIQTSPGGGNFPSNESSSPPKAQKVPQVSIYCACFLAYYDSLFKRYLHLVRPKATWNSTASDSERQCQAANIRSLLWTCLLLRLLLMSHSGCWRLACFTCLVIIMKVSTISQLCVTYELPYQSVSIPWSF